jgi:hypothetical protein
MTDKLTPAPLNQKDIMEDALFENLFDYLPGYVERNHCALGFINDEPVAVDWSFGSHVIHIWPHNYKKHDEAMNTIVKKLEEMNADKDCETYCEIQKGKFQVTASFYYREE